MSEFSVNTTREEVVRLLKLAAPVAGAQLGAQMLGIVDMMMLGRVGGTEMAAATLGNLVLMGITIPLMGLLIGADPLMSQAHGAGHSQRMGRVLQGGILLLPLISIPIFFAGLFAPELLRAFGQPDKVIDLAKNYIYINMPSMPLFLGFSLGRQWLQARSIVRPAVWIVLIANAINAVANWALIFGNLGLPAMGIDGCAIATVVTRSLMLVMLLLWVKRGGLARGAWVPWDRESFRLSHMTQITKYGWAIMISFAVEMWAFQALSLMAGNLGEDSLAAHSLVMQLVSLIFMIPLGIGIAASVRVGNLIGARDPLGAQRTAHVALALTGAFMAMISMVFIVFRNGLPHLFTSDPKLVAIAAGLFPIAACFQLCDGIQGVCGGILRGMGRVRAPALAHALGLYALGLPLGHYLASRHEPEIGDYYWGFCVGLFIVATLLTSWVFLRGPKTVKALEQEAT
ncbi:MAG: MATE family efflux transporter [Planctomycetota bacterium]|nr:MATE family efflux transporter [Planctomycetota bacterium]MDG2143374.1 MATE family efflux transporter [Planctomycetota bacterium]